MSRIDDLIAQLCPSGVEYESLGDVASVATGVQLNRSRLTNDGSYPVFNGGIGPSGRHSAFNTGADTLTVSQGGASAGYVNFVREPFWAGAHCYVVQPNPLSVRALFLYFVLKSRQGALQAAKLGAGIPGLSRKALLTFRVPTPPMEVQDAVVSVLQTFVELETQLEAELVARRRQYEHYRDSLLTFEGGSGWTTLNELAENLDSRRRPVTKAARVAGDIPYYGASGVVDYVSEYIFEGDYLLVSEDGANLLARSTPIAFSISGKAWVNNHAHVLRFATYVERRLVEIYLNSVDLSPYVSGGAQPKLNQANLNKIPIPVLRSIEQDRIVSILDKFDALVNDLSIGIPAELNARRKQHEYYRDRLLAFPEAA